MSILNDCHNASCSINKKSRCCAIKPSNLAPIQGNFHGRAQCSQRTSTRLHLRRHPWTVLWSHGALQNRRQHSPLQLPLPGRLCRQRILLNWDCLPPIGSQGEIQREIDNFERKSWVQEHHPELRLLRWMHEEVWEQ